MAEIPIQQKRRGPGIWPWLVGALAVLLLVWVVRARNSTATASNTYDTTTAGGTVALPPGSDSSMTSSRTTTRSSSSSATQAITSPALTDFVTYAGTPVPKGDETSIVQYTADGLRRLADALGSVNAPGAALDSMRTQVSALQDSSVAGARHADMVRSAFLAAANAFDSLKTSGGTAMTTDVAKVRAAARAMKPGLRLQGQETRIQTFFDAARMALNAMAHPTP